jgi:hypothetical protein
MGGLDALVVKPHRDHREIYAGLQQVHRRGLPDRVGQSWILLSAGAVFAARSRTTSKRCSIPERVMCPPREFRDKRRIERCPGLLEPTTDEAYRLTPERDRPVFAPFPTNVNRPAGGPGLSARWRSSSPCVFGAV